MLSLDSICNDITHTMVIADFLVDDTNEYLFRSVDLLFLSAEVVVLITPMNMFKILESSFIFCIGFP